MTISHPRRVAVGRGPAALGRAALPRMCGMVVACGLLAAAIATAAEPAALASPSVPGSPSHTSQAAGKFPSKPAAGRLSWSEVPASATAPDSRLKFSYVTIKPGSSISDHVAVINRSSQAVAFTLYGTDAIGTTARNTLILLPAAKKPVDIGSWVKFPGHLAQLSLIIPAHKGVIEAFKVAVPQQATPGDHTGAMIASVAFQRKNALGQVVTIDDRVAVPIELRVTGPLHARLRVESISPGYNNAFSPFTAGSANVSYSVVNTGNVRLSGQQAVSVSGLFGISAKVRLAALPVVLPGDAVRITERAAGLYPAGPLTAKVHISPANPTGAPPIPEPVATSGGSASFFAVPWSLIGLLVLIAGAVAGGWQWWRWRRRRLRAALVAVAEHARREAEQRMRGDAAQPAAPAQGQA